MWAAPDRRVLALSQVPAGVGRIGSMISYIMVLGHDTPAYDLKTDDLRVGNFYLYVRCCCSLMIDDKVLLSGLVRVLALLWVLYAHVCVVILGLGLGIAGNRHKCLMPIVNCGYGNVVSLTAAVATRAELFPCRCTDRNCNRDCEPDL